MKTRDFLNLGAALTLSTGVGLGVAACGHRAEDCEERREPCDSGPSTTTTTSGGGHGQGGDGGGGAGQGGDGGGGSIDPGCVPSDVVGAVDDACGVFVSPAQGDDSTATGSKASPFATIAQAHANSPSKPVYLCIEPALESLVSSDPLIVFGGLDCSNGWLYVGETTRSEWLGLDSVPTLTLGPAAAGSALFDLNLGAAKATVSGASSLAVLVEGGALALTRVDVTADDAAPGVNGAAFAVPASSGSVGDKGLDACTGDMVFGGAGAVNDCPDGTSSVGGLGGVGAQASGGAGSPGEPQGAANGGSGGATCTAGTAGVDGLPGPNGPGAVGLGTLSASGFQGVSGGDGGFGTAAQAGGGGGGSKGGTAAGQCPNVVGQRGGAGGGGGGSGGCGGAGGHGGGPAGASIGILSLNAALTLDTVRITTGAGGSGGPGGAGQVGGVGASGGLGGAPVGSLLAGCFGGAGGDGGQGGRGGGGLGGSSLGIAFTGAAPETSGVVFQLGVAGPGGAGADASADGAPGIFAETQGF